MRKNGFRIQARLGLDHKKRRGRQPIRRFERRNYVTDSLDPGVGAAQEERHIGAELDADGLQLGGAEPQVPEFVQGQQGGGCIGRAAAHAGLRWDALGHADVGARLAPRGGL